MLVTLNRKVLDVLGPSYYIKNIPYYGLSYLYKKRIFFSELVGKLTTTNYCSEFISDNRDICEIIEKAKIKDINDNMLTTILSSETEMI